MGYMDLYKADSGHTNFQLHNGQSINSHASIAALITQSYFTGLCGVQKSRDTDNNIRSLRGV